jgi:hypothetical protein
VQLPVLQPLLELPPLLLHHGIHALLLPAQVLHSLLHLLHQ